MHVAYLSLTTFRNYARLETMLPNSAVVLHGENAQGKTNLLEAIYYLATSRSPHTSLDRQLLHWCTEDDPLPFARIAADVMHERRGTERLEITLMVEQMPDGHPRLRRPVSVRHNELMITLTALPSGRLVLQSDREPDQHMIDAAPDRVVLELLCAVARGNVARLLAERWRPYAAYCS